MDGDRLRQQLNMMMLRLADFSSSLRDLARISLEFVRGQRKT